MHSDLGRGRGWLGFEQRMAKSGERLVGGCASPGDRRGGRRTGAGCAPIGGTGRGWEGISVATGRRRTEGGSETVEVFEE